MRKPMWMLVSTSAAIMSGLSLSLIYSLIYSTSANAQQIFKWVDADGNVNYSTSRPADRDARALDANDSRLTVLPAPPKAPALSPEAQMQRVRIARMEEDQARLRSANAAQTRASAEQLRAWRERCERDRRVDCADDQALARDYGLYFWPRVGIRADGPAPGTQLIAPAIPPAPPALRSPRAG